MTPHISPDKDSSVSVSIPTDFSSHPFTPPPLNSSAPAAPWSSRRSLGSSRVLPLPPPRSG